MMKKENVEKRESDREIEMHSEGRKICELKAEQRGVPYLNCET